MKEKVKIENTIFYWDNINIIEFVKRATVLFVSLLFLYFFTIFNSQLINELLTKFCNIVIRNFDSLEYLKFFNENDKLLLFFRFDHHLNPKPQFSYVSIEIFTHFIFPNITYIGLIISSYYKSISIKRVLLGLILINLLFVIKLIIIALENGLKETIFDNSGNIKEFKIPNDAFYNFIQLLNKIFNQYGSISLRLLVVVVIWAWVIGIYRKIKQI